MNIHLPCVSVDKLSSAPLRRQHRIIVHELAKAYPDPVKTADLVHALYGHDPDGGPEIANHAVSSMIGHVRVHLGKVGWTIPLAKRGPSAPGYRLEPIGGGK